MKARVAGLALIVLMALLAPLAAEAQQAARVYRSAPTSLWILSWRPQGELSRVNWCGRAVEVVLIPKGDGWCSERPIRGEAA